MSTGFLPTTLDTIGTSLSIIAAADPVTKPGGMTIAWGTVAAVGADTTYLDGVTVKSGAKALRYGQCMCEITKYEVQTITIAGGATGGTFPITVTINGVARTTPQLAWNATAAVVLAALEALDNVGPGNATVSVSGGVYTITLLIPGNHVALITSAAALTGGTPTAVVAEVTAGDANAGMFGPHDPAATDGRQTVTRGKAFWLPRTVRELDAGSLYAPGLEGGRVYLERLIQSGTATSTLALGPQLATVNSVFPGLRYA